MPLTIRLPTPEEEERTRRFQVHKNYVGGVAQFIRAEYGSRSVGRIETLTQAQKHFPSFRRIKRRPVDQDRLEQFLTLSWASELQFRLARLSDPVLLRYSNAWAPIHAYYAVYMSAQAWFLTIGSHELVDNHTGSLNTLSNQVSQRGLFPAPWNVTCSGCPHIDEITFSNLPVGVNPESHFELLAAPSLQDFWPRYCKLLETTRKRRLDRNIDEWKRKERRKNTWAHEKRAIASRLLPTTLFDFFWRLRVRSNYRDVRSFLMAGVAEDWQREFFQALETILESTVLLLEGLIVAYAGSDTYERTLDGFLRSQRHDLTELRDPYLARAAALTNRTIEPDGSVAGAPA